jgi:hypothetical protein
MAEMRAAAGGSATVRRFALISPAIWAAVLGGLAVLSMVVILLFPDGTLSSRSWRWALRAYGVVYAALVATFVVDTVDGLTAHPVLVDGTGGLSERSAVSVSRRP